MSRNPIRSYDCYFSEKDLTDQGHELAGERQEALAVGTVEREMSQYHKVRIMLLFLLVQVLL